MGDVLSLIEKAETAYKEEEAEKLQEKMRKNSFTLEDFLEQMEKIRNMGPLDQLVKMLPGAQSKLLKKSNFDENDMNQIEAIIRSMTRAERLKPNIIDGSRRQRIATGSGTSLQQVNRLLKQFDQMKSMMKKFKNQKHKLGGNLLGL